MALGTLPEDAKQHTHPSRYAERLERPLAEPVCSRPGHILKALAPLLIDWGLGCLHGLCSLDSPVLHRLLDLRSSLLYLCAPCLGRVLALSVRHGCARLLHLR
jgi:hypothetical protein